VFLPEFEKRQGAVGVLKKGSALTEPHKKGSKMGHFASIKTEKFT
jgi:hypothetical protein